jgi:hypothetical protein
VLRVPIVFTPRECVKYRNVIAFDINGLNRIEVEVTGEGIPLKLECEKAEHQNL